MSTIAIDSEKVRSICAEHGIETDQAFALEIGVDKGTVSRVMAGQAPGPKFISSVLLRLPVKFEDVFDVVDDADTALAAEERKSA